MGATEGLESWAHEPRPEQVIRELTAALQAWDPADEGLRQRFQELLRSLWESGGVLGAPPPMESETPPSLVSHTQRLVAQWLGDPNLSVKTLAHAQGVNPDYLSRVFKRSSGVALGELIARRRVEKAMVLLTSPGARVSVAEVARACGYGSPRQFLRVFKQWAGEPPRAYSRRHGGIGPQDGFQEHIR